MTRLFVAVWPPRSLIERLQGLERPERPGLRWTTEDQWHVTLRFLGRVDPAGESALREALGTATAEVPAVEVSAGPRPRALGQGVWVLPVGGLETVAERIAAATSEIGRPPPTRRFRGHITLARARHARALSGLAAGEVAADEVAARWKVSEITLVRSDLRPEGALYRVVGRWPLRGTG